MHCLYRLLRIRFLAQVFSCRKGIVGLRKIQIRTLKVCCLSLCLYIFPFDACISDPVLCNWSSFMCGFLYGLSVVVYVMDACLHIYLCISLYTYLSVCACACLCVRMFIHGLLTSCKVMHSKQWKQHTFINSWCTKLISEICIKGKMSSGKKLRWIKR